jgi:hypothetical protein
MQAKIQLMRSPQWLSRKNNYPLAALYSALWWGSCALLCFGIQSVQAATIQSTGEHPQVTKNDRHIAHTKPANKFPQPDVFHKCGAINGIFLRLSRKPGPYDASAPAAPATWLYLDERRELRLLSGVTLNRLVDRRDIYLSCCSLLI